MGAFDDVNNSSDSQVADTSGDRSTDSGSVSRGVWDDIASSSTTNKSSDSTAGGSNTGTLDMSSNDIYASHDSDLPSGKTATAVLEKPADTGSDSATATTTADNAAGTPGTDNSTATTPTDTNAGNQPTDTATTTNAGSDTATTTTDNAAGTPGTDNSTPTTPTDTNTGNQPSDTATTTNAGSDTAAATTTTDTAAGTPGTDNSTATTPTDTNAGNQPTDTATNTPSDTGAGSPPAATDSMTGTTPTDNSAGAPPPSSDSPSFFSHPLDWAENKAQSAEQGASDLWHKVTGSGDTPADKPADTPAQPTDTSKDNSEQQALQKIQDDPQVQAQKQQLESNLSKLHDQQKIGDDDYKQAQDNITKLEQRAAKTDPPLDPSEVSGTLSNVNKMLENTSQTPIPAGSRQEIALDVLNQAADPTKINQGDHSTCTVASLEVTSYTKSPAEASDLVQQVTSTGQYVTKDGLTVKVPPQDLQTPDDPSYGMSAGRTFGSQIFQDTAANIKYAEYNKENGTNYAFVHDHADNPNGKPPASGDDVVDLNTGKSVKKDLPGVSSSDLADTYHQITGKPADGMVIQNANYKDGDSSGVKDISSPQDLDKALADAKANHKFPLMMRVHTGNQPFYEDSDNGKAGGSGGWHMVTVTDYDPNTKNAQVENTWGPKANHFGDKPIPLNQLYQSSKNSSDIELPVGP